VRSSLGQTRDVIAVACVRVVRGGPRAPSCVGEVVSMSAGRHEMSACRAREDKGIDGILVSGGDLPPFEDERTRAKLPTLSVQFFGSRRG